MTRHKCAIIRTERNDQAPPSPTGRVPVEGYVYPFTDTPLNFLKRKKLLVTTPSEAQKKNHAAEDLSPVVLRFTLPILPRGQKRPRATAVRVAGGRFAARAYKDSAQRNYEAKLRALLEQHRPETPWQGPVELRVLAFMPIPASKSLKWKTAAAAGAVRHVSKPDVSNIVKQVEDVMNGLFWRDDAQVVSVVAEKLYSVEPRYEISVTCLPGNL